MAIILGSGLGEFAESLTFKKVIDTSDIPHYPVSTVEGHHGKLIFGKLHSTPLLAFQGRVHYYESGKLESVLYPIRVAHNLGIKTLIVTNAAGGVNMTFEAGDLMMISDQINLTFENPLVGTRKRSRKQKLYDENFQDTILKIAAEKKIKLQRGVYCGVKGPSYETAAEIEMVRRLGGDAVGMSTVNEVSLAVALGIHVAGISCITNLATGILDLKLSHAEVTDVANKVKHTFAELLKGVIEKI
jgi:purine-nucleoside phosphorylase